MSKGNADQEIQILREKVAACTLLLNFHNIMNYSGHVSARIPGTETFLIQPIDQPRSGLRPEHLLLCDYDGKVLEGRTGSKPPAEVALHCELLRARPDVMSIAHFHHDMTNVFTLVEDVPLHLLKNHSVRWTSGIPVHNDPSHVANPDLGRAVAKTLGPHHALQIRAHGQVITAESVEAVLIDSVHFVENGMANYYAASIGRIAPLTKQDIANFERDFKRQRHIDKLWQYYVDGGRTQGIIPKEWTLY